MSSEGPTPADNDPNNPRNFQPNEIKDLIKKEAEKASSDSISLYPWNEKEFNALYDAMIEKNDALIYVVKGKFMDSKKSIIIKPKDQKPKEDLYNILKRIDILYAFTPTPPGASESADDKKKREAENLKGQTNAPILKKTMAAKFFSDCFIKATSPGEKISLGFEDTTSVDFIARFIELDTSDALNAVGRFLPVISSLRHYYLGKYTISFDTDQLAKDAIQKQLQDAKTGRDNEFSMMSIVGSDSQKVAARSAFITGAATGLWALIEAIQKNPTVSAIVMGAITTAGPQAIAVGAVLAVGAVGYYVVLKLQDKYAKFFILIRTLNEFLVLLNKIDRLIRLSLTISKEYKFNINIKEIEEQLKIIFKRFDKMLEEDDFDSISNSVKNIKETGLPDLEKAATDAAERVAAAAVNSIENEEGKKTDAAAAAAAGGRTEQVGGGLFDGLGKAIGKTVFRLTFDADIWNQKLNDDVVKLNIYLTTAMSEFGIILNVIQMSMITTSITGAGATLSPKDSQSEAGKAATRLKETNDAVKGHTDYKKMIIGILLNDILKLRVDFSYCRRRAGVLTNTKGELVCLENLTTDGFGNKTTKYRQLLHGYMKDLVENGLKNEEYPKEGVRDEIQENVVKPYVAMLKTANYSGPDFNKRFHLTTEATFTGNEQQAFQAGRDTMIREIDKTYQGLTQQVGGWGISKETKPTPDNDVKIKTNYLIKFPYETITDDEIVRFLDGVNKYINSSTKPSNDEKLKVQKAAIENAKLVMNDESILAVAVKDADAAAAVAVPAASPTSPPAAAPAADPAAAPAAAPASPAAAAADDTVQGENRGPKPGELEAEDKFYNEGKEAGIGGIIKNGGGKSRKRIRRHKPVVRATRKREYKPTIACNKYKMARSIKKKMAARSIKK